MRKFRCMPMALSLPIVFLFNVLCWIFLQLWTRLQTLLPITIFFCSFSFTLAVLTMIPAIRRIELYETKIICKGFLPLQTYELEYNKSNVGMDYSLQGGRKIWWIYICYGAPPQFKSTNSVNRVNAVKFQPGYIKMHYTDDVYNALLEVLPKKQRTALISSKKRTVSRTGDGLREP